MHEMMLPSSEKAQAVIRALTKLQERFRDRLNLLAKRHGDGKDLSRSLWLRDHGQHGGGWRWGIVDSSLLNRTSLNISSVHYEDLEEKRLQSANALSCIVHPQAPRAPSLHTHISWTELKQGAGGGWRLMADLNPSCLIEEDRDHFVREVEHALSSRPKEWINDAKAQGDRYFWIPALERHRGAAHFYIEQWSTGSFNEDLDVATRFGERVIDTYVEIFERALDRDPEEVSLATAQRQLEYHSLYFLQVLTLDRGTSSGLLVHNQNDKGIMGSLPQRVNRSLLRSWVPKLPKPQDALLSRLCDALSPEDDADVCILDDQTRVKLAQIVREHYQAHPEALALQARGSVLPPTVANHSSERSENKPTG